MRGESFRKREMSLRRSFRERKVISRERERERERERGERRERKKGRQRERSLRERSFREREGGGGGDNDINTTYSASPAPAPSRFDTRPKARGTLHCKGRNACITLHTDTAEEILRAR